MKITTALTAPGQIFTAQAAYTLPLQMIASDLQDSGVETQVPVHTAGGVPKRKQKFSNLLEIDMFQNWETLAFKFSGQFLSLKHTLITFYRLSFALLG